MKHFRELLAKIKKADELFNLIQDGDKIVIGISGGKDSIVLFTALNTYKRYSQKTFTLYPVILDLGFTPFDASAYIAFFNNQGYDLIVNDSRDVAKILEIQQTKQGLAKLPCSICSRMKKAAINEVAHKLGANKVAFAHHIDDALETLFMNMVSGGRIATFSPQMYLERAEITFIRPLILSDEKLITRVQKDLKLPLLVNNCPNEKKTRREDIKHVLKSIYKDYPEAKSNFELMLLNDKELDLWFKDYATLLNDDYVIVKVTTPAQFNDVAYIRYKVFVEEQKIKPEDEYDAHEFDYTSLVLYVNKEKAATIRYKYDAKERMAYLGRIAVLKAYRGRQLGSTLISYVEQILSVKYRPLTFHIGGQSHLLKYYENLGYTRIGEPYIDAEILHYHFIKKIN
ncbi:MAG: tRNA 2-thiocytidine biosynthesis protein TtcA [Tenericutes bacterium ADurb.Bin087]|nr:MAG: tRNA 2-thiocytidine biosynthesis protein TtcA [Tenericutes bacterium ADurb.Bin087]